MKNFILIMFCVSISPVFADSGFDFSDCSVVEIVVAGGQNAHVQLSCAVANVPACVTASNYVAFDKSTAAGKQYLALFTMAFAMNAKVAGFVDHTSCPAWQPNVSILTHLRVVK